MSPIFIDTFADKGSYVIDPPVIPTLTDEQQAAVDAAIKEVMGDEAEMRATFDPDEPRDDKGEWTSGGAGDSPSPTPSSDLASMTPDELTEHMADVVERQAVGIAGGLDTRATYDMVNGQVGRYTEARQQEQQKIIDGFLNKPGVQSDHQLLIMAGLPGSGKTTFLSNHAQSLGIDSKSYVDVNPDEVRTAMQTAGMVPDYSDLGLTNQEIGTFSHEEASTITGLIAAQAAAQGKNIAVDSTMKNNAQFEKYITAVNGMSDEPYHTTMILIDSTKDESIKNAIGRYQRGGRFVPLGNIQNMNVTDDGKTPSRVTFDNNSDKVDRAILVNNDRQIESDTKPNAPVTTTPEMLASMHSNDLRDPDGGFTLDPATGESPPGTGDMSGKGPYAVAVGNPYSSGALPATPDQFVKDASGYTPMDRQIVKFMDANVDKLHEDGMYLGGWHAVDEKGADTGLAYLDVTQVIPRGDGALESAKALGAERDQIAITDLSTFASINTGGTGEKKDE